MDLTQLANLGEFIGGIAVLVTLIYLVVQVRQGNSNARASSRQTLIETWSQTQLDLAHHPDLLRILGEGFSDYLGLPNEDRIRFDFVMSRYVSNVYNGVLLHQEGMLDIQTLDQIGSLLVGVVASPGGSQWWDTWPQPEEALRYVSDYPTRHSGRISPYHEIFPYWVPAPGTQ